MRGERLFRVGVVAALAISLVLGALAFMEARTDYQVMSVSGYALRIEDGTGSEIFGVTDAGNTTVGGTFTSNGAGDFDSTLNADGAVTLNSTLDVAGSINYGSNDMYPLGYASTGQEIVCATTTITGENQSIAVTGVTTVTYGWAWLITDPGTGDGDPFMVTADAPSGSDGNLVINVWQDAATAASSGAVVGYCAIGDE